MTSQERQERKDSDPKRWAFMRPFRVDKSDGLYLWRLNVLVTPWLGIKLHWIRMPDQDPDPHDHPWSFFSIVLRGWYREAYIWEASNLAHERRVSWFNLKRAEDAHRIVSLPGSGAWTLVFTGPWRRDWGFITPRGWVHWKKYLESES